jgi:hypothetical protein
LAANSGAYTSGKPPPTTSARVPAGNAVSRNGSTVDTSAPAPASNSTVSAYPKLNAAPPATATTGRPGTGGETTGDHGDTASGGAVRAAASTAGRSTDAATSAANDSTDATASGRRSATGTSPRCRDGTATVELRRSTPRTGAPTSSSAARRIASCRSDPTRLRITPARRTVPNDRNPCTSAATERPCAAASTASSTGADSNEATSAVEPASPEKARPS